MPSPPSMLVGQTAQAVRDKRELVIATTPTNGLLLTKALSELRRCEPGLVIRVCRANDADDVLRIVQDGTAEIGFSELTPLVSDSQLTGFPSPNWRWCSSRRSAPISLER